MKKILKTLLIILILIFITCLMFLNAITTDKIETNNETLIISVCTGDMRALETGISVYAGYNQVPLILTDKTLPEQLKKWLPSYILENNIKKIIIVGDVTPYQMFEFLKLGVDVKQIKGQSIPDILTKIADNAEDINHDSIILTASDPLAGVLGAYTKTPVFITASNSTYESSESLDERYIDYIINHEIKHVTIVGNIPNNIINQLNDHNISIEQISGQNSLEVSNNINNKLKNEGYLANLSTAYYGFYGELPTIVPTVIQDNAIMIEDSSNTGDIIPYLKQNNITTLYITRNTESDYLMMEETDYVSSKVIKNLKNNNITIKYLTKTRTLDEATGLYDMKILSAEKFRNNMNNTYDDNITKIMKSKPPLIEILNHEFWVDSNNITANVSKENDDITVKWSTIHPYTWKKVSENEYYATSNTGYEYFWIKNNNSWTVEYKYNNTTYYNITWKHNDDESWTEIHEQNNYTWKYDGKIWGCYNKNNEIIYYIQKI